jgi:DNA-binding SARP family transcriptional activator
MPDQPAAERSLELTSTRLQVNLLGPPTIEWGGHPLTIRRRQVRALVYHLAARLEPIPREHLCYLFWPDSPEAAGRRKLSHLLTHLRHALPALDVMLIDKDHVALNPHKVRSDTVAFERLSTAPKLHQNTEALQEATHLYRGPFLAGFSLPDSPELETWIVLERSNWERQYLEVLAALVEEQMAQSNYHAAIARARCYLEIDNLAEEMHRTLIRLYTIVGNRNGALRQYEQCVMTLKRELGVNPLPETRSAYQAVLEGRSLSLQPPASPPEWTTLPSLDAPLIGRDEALGRLEQAYNRAQSGVGQIMLLSGEPGIGKSRLMEHFVTQWETGANVVVGGGNEAEQNLPYWPLIEALRPQLSNVSLITPTIEPLYLAELARLWPELHSLVPGLPTPTRLEEGQERGRLFQALSCWLIGLAAWRPPLVLCLDDLHWVDEATLSLLGYVARKLRHAPLLVLGAYRSEEKGSVAMLRRELMHLGLLQEFRLKGLTQNEILRLVRHLSSQRRGGELISQRLHRITGGNPFFVLEIMRVVLEGHLTWQDETIWRARLDEITTDHQTTPLPATVCEAIQTRLVHLSPRARQLLDAGAVIGRRFSFELAQNTSGRCQSEAIEALDELLARQLIAEGDADYLFKHDLIRTVVYRDLSRGRRRLLHRRAGEALRRLRPDDAAALTWHFERAEEPSLAARYAIKAGQAAKAVFAHTEACAHFDRALVCLEKESAGLRAPQALAANQHLRIEALCGRGWALRLLGDMHAFARDTEEVARLAEHLGDHRVLAHVHWRKAYTQRWFCCYAAAREAAQEGLRLSQAVGDPLLEAMCQREAGLAAREMVECQPARASLEFALRRFSELGETVYEIHTLGNLSTLCCRAGAYDEAMRLAYRALDMCEEVQLPLERRLPLGDIGAAAIALGDSRLAQQCLYESLAIARQIADCTQEILCLGHLGWLCLGLKRPDQALGFLHVALVLAESIDSRAEQSWLWSGLAEAHRLTGDGDSAAEHAYRALEQAEATKRPYDQDMARRILARCNGPRCSHFVDTDVLYCSVSLPAQR